MADHIRYDLLTQQALRGVVRNVLADTAKKGLLGDHHFFISFRTHAEGVRLSDRLRAQYPEEMTIILQYQFWDLSVTDVGFEVGMSFGGIPEKLYVPFAAVTGFFDPSVQFGLQFEEVVEGQTADAAGKGSRPEAVPAATDLKVVPAEQKTKSPTGPSSVSSVPSVPSAISPAPAVPAAPTEPDPDKPSGGGEVVRLDRFRKK